MKEKTTTIEVNEATRNVLMLMKIKLRVKRMDGVINYLIRRQKK